VEEIKDFEQYGVNWDDYNNVEFMWTLQTTNPEDRADVGDFRLPEHVVSVNCKPLNSPLSTDEVRELDDKLQHCLGDVYCSCDMAACNAVWQAALAIIMCIIHHEHGKLKQLSDLKLD
jgi:hypothetical protein